MGSVGVGLFVIGGVTAGAVLWVAGGPLAGTGLGTLLVLGSVAHFVGLLGALALVPGYLERAARSVHARFIAPGWVGVGVAGFFVHPLLYGTALCCVMVGIGIVGRRYRMQRPRPRRVDIDDVFPGEALLRYVTLLIAGIGLAFLPARIAVWGGLAMVSMIVGLTVVRSYRQRHWRRRLESTLAEVLEHVPEFEAGDLGIRVFLEVAPNAHPGRTGDGRPLVFVSMGMVIFWDDPEVVWTILAHEVGHHVLGHTDSMSSQPATVSRAWEIEADQYAARLALRAGRDPTAAIRGLKIVEPIEKRLLGDNPRPDTHPTADQRIAAIRAAIDESVTPR